MGMVEAWVCAPSFDEAGGEAVPGVFHYLPVTLIQQTSKVTDSTGPCDGGLAACLLGSCYIGTLCM